jgi:hypothetical protein
MRSRGPSSIGCRVGVGGDALVAGEVGAGLAIDAAEGALFEDVGPASWSHSVRTRTAAVLGARFEVKGVRRGAPDRADARRGRVDRERVDLADEDAARAAGLGGEELEAAGLVVLAEVVAARDGGGVSV